MHLWEKKSQGTYTTFLTSSNCVHQLTMCRSIFKAPRILYWVSVLGVTLHLGVFPFFSLLHLPDLNTRGRENAQRCPSDSPQVRLSE